MTGQRFRDLDAARRRREVLKVVVTLLLVGGALMTLYYVAPIDTNSVLGGLVLLLVVPLTYAAALNRQFRNIALADVPELRAMQAVVINVLLFLVLFATIYLALSADSPARFSEPLSHTRALYFTITVFSTVGFGDITPVTDLASIVVAFQMLLDLVVIWVVVRAFINAARSGVGVSGSDLGPMP